MKLQHASWFLCFVALTASPAAGFGSGCVHDFSPGLSCSGTDVAVTRIKPVSILEDCPSGVPGSAMAVFEIRIAAGTAGRSDIGVFMAFDGNSALSGGNCVHDYLQPPLTNSPVYTDTDGNGRPEIVQGPWWNAEPGDQQDECGDMAASTDALKTLAAFRFTCADSNGDGYVDFSWCTSWSSGTMSTCQGLSDAAPPTAPRCNCNVVQTGIAMLGGGGRISGLTVARSGASNLMLAWSPSCSAADTDYAVYEGSLGAFGVHHSVACSTGGSTSATFQPAAGNGYYLVVPRNAQREGSYGKTSTGVERAVATNACLPQVVQSPCF